MLAVTIWGAEAVLTKMFLSDVLAPGAMLMLRVLITALVAALQLDRQNWFWLLWMGGISSGLAYVFYYKGCKVRMWSSPVWYFLSTSNLWSVRQPVVVQQVNDDDPDRCQALMEVMDVA